MAKKAEAKEAKNVTAETTETTAEALPAHIPDPLAGSDPMEEYVEIELFGDNGKYKDDVYVAVNGENCVIKRGEPVKVKRKFAEVVKNQLREDQKTQAMIRELTEKAEKKTDF